jgi:hypothetical protein
MNKEEVKQLLRIDLLKLSGSVKAKDTSPEDSLYVESNEELYRIVGLVR